MPVNAERSSLKMARSEIAASGALQRYYPWVVITIAFFTVAGRRKAE